MLDLLRKLSRPVCDPRSEMRGNFKVVFMRVLIKNILNCEIAVQNEVLTLRNLPTIRERMFGDHEISIEEHRNWVASLSKNNTQRVFLVFSLNRVIGSLAFKNINYDKVEADWAFYLSQKNNSGLGACLEFTALDYAFMDMKLEKLKCSVLENNPAVLKLHKKFGFVEDFLSETTTLKQGDSIKVKRLSISKNDWLEMRQKIKIKYGALLNRHQLKIDDTTYPQL